MHRLSFSIFLMYLSYFLTLFSFMSGVCHSFGLSNIHFPIFIFLSTFPWLCFHSLLTYYFNNNCLLLCRCLSLSVFIFISILVFLQILLIIKLCLVLLTSMLLLMFLWYNTVFLLHLGVLIPSIYID